MTFKQFTIKILTYVCILITCTFGVNIYFDEFGLFTSDIKKDIRIFGNERKSKHLLTYNYIPHNFDGVLIGPSLSYVEMDTRNIKKQDIYNLSVNGANMTELRYLVEKVYLNGKIKTLIICLDPYVFADSMMKSSSLNENEYFQSLFSIEVFKYYLRKWKALIKPLEDPLRDSYWGFRYNNHYLDQTLSKQNIMLKSKKIMQNKNFEIKVDEKALKELKKLLESSLKNNVQVYAYFYPQPYDVYETEEYRSQYNIFKKQVLDLFTNNEVVLDLNQNKYNYIRKEYTMYSDASHLSRLGARRILRIIDNFLK